MKKRIIKHILSIVVFTTMLCGCGESDTPVETITDDNTVIEEQAEESAEGDIESSIETTDSSEEDASSAEESEEKDNTIDIDPEEDYDIYYVDESGNIILGLNMLPYTFFSTDERVVKTGTKLSIKVFDSSDFVGYVDCASKESDIKEYGDQLHEYLTFAENSAPINHPMKSMANKDWSSPVELLMETETSDGIVYTFSATDESMHNTKYDISYLVTDDYALRLFILNMSSYKNCPFYAVPSRFMTALLDYDNDEEIYCSVQTLTRAKHDDWEAYRNDFRSDSVGSQTQTIEASEDTSVEVVGEETSTAEGPKQPSPSKASGGKIVLADGREVSPESTITLNDLSGANYIVPGNEDVWFAIIVSMGEYRMATDPEVNWAYDAEKRHPGDKIPLDKYIDSFNKDADYDYICFEMRGSSDIEAGFYVTR